MQIVQKLKAGFRLHTVFAGILLFVLLLPLSGGYFFRIYENELVRQTGSPKASLFPPCIKIGWIRRKAMAT